MSKDNNRRTGEELVYPATWAGTRLPGAPKKLKEVVGVDTYNQALESGLIDGTEPIAGGGGTIEIDMSDPQTIETLERLRNTVDRLPLIELADK